jgi:uncharacterized protein YjbJ (UPF0337 family)
LETRTPETGLILKTGPLTSQSPTGEPIMGSTTDKVKKGIDQAAGTLKPATDKAAGTIKDTAHQAGKTMKAAGQRVKDAAE